jgi:hypothetical protein
MLDSRRVDCKSLIVDPFRLAQTFTQDAEEPIGATTEQDISI